MPIDEEVTNFDTNDLPLKAVIAVIGWTEDEFIDATEDYNLPVTDYNWEKVLGNLWVLTYARIRSQSDLSLKFKKYSDWGVVMQIAIALNKRKLLANKNCGDLKLIELIAELARQNKPWLLPEEDLEAEVVWAFVHLVTQVHSYFYLYPEAAFVQLITMRKDAEKRKVDAEKRREARFHRRQAQKKKKRNRH